MMRTPSVSLVSLLALLAGCKTKEVVKPDEETAKQLAACKQSVEDKDKLIALLRNENADLQIRKGGGEVVVKIEGGNTTVTAADGGNLPIDQKVAAAGAQEFLGIVEKSRGSIQKCYQQVLKKSEGLQGKPVSLTVQATFTPQGEVASATSEPSLGPQFDGCLKLIAQKWMVKGSSTSMTYRQVVQLKPS
jgi:hypothetical protein